MNWNPFNPKRDADFVVGTRDNPYLKRWFLIPRNRLFNVYLHEFWRDDDDRALHDHPWWSVSIMLSGHLREILADGSVRVVNQAGQVIFRKASHLHRLEVVEKPSRTLFITGPKFREWGFACPQGWRHWKDFVGEDTGTVGRGCE